MKLSVIIPCYNEIKTIQEIIKRVKNEKNYEKEIIVIDDSSNDSLAKLKELEMMTQYLEENADKLSSLNNEMKS